jgi:hypothetical protein
VDELTEDDHLFSSFAYGWECKYFDNMFVNVANLEDGSTWSTPWVIDDPQFFVVPPEGYSIADLVRRPQKSSVASRSTGGTIKSIFGKAMKR